MKRSAEDQAAWDAACERYIESLKGKTDEELAHCNCDHAYGYCAN